MGEELMKQRDLVLSIIDLCCDRPEFGRTSLQKVAYFVSQGLHQQLGHKAHFYGPFSEDVEDDVEGLLLAGLIDEKATSLGFQSYGGDAAKKYEYSMTDAGNERVEALRGAYPEEFQSLATFIERLEQAAGGLDQSVLSPAAKTYFIASREHRPVKTSEIRTFGAQLGWNLQRKQVLQVVAVLKTLGLVKQSAPAGTS
jgi:uncharacterized protein YwgA